MSDTESDTGAGTLAPGLRQLLPLPYGAAREARRNPLGFLMDGRRRFGDVFRYQIGPWCFNLISHPDGVRQILQDNYTNYPRSHLYKFTRLVIGDGLVSTEGDKWRRQRRMVQPAFHSQRIAALGQHMVEATARMLADWDNRPALSSQPFDVAAEMTGLTLRIVGTTLLGVDLSGETDRIGPAVAEALAYLDHRINNQIALPLAIPTPRNLRFRRAMRTLNGVVYDIIHQRRAHPEERVDLLSLMMSVRDEQTGTAMTDLELRDQIMTFIGAGHETTAVALAWIWYVLGKHPDVERRFRDELETVLGGRPPAVTDLPALRYTRMVIEETLRLYPPVYAVVRDVLREDSIGGYRIAAGTSVIVCQYVTHRHPGVWDRPDEFDPERFAPDSSHNRPKFAYFPFLGGPHFCIGAEFAMMEATLIVAMVAQRYHLALVSSEQPPIKPMLSLRPRDGVWVTARPVTSPVHT